jgi:hypothetical protein
MNGGFMIVVVLVLVLIVGAMGIRLWAEMVGRKIRGGEHLNGFEAMMVKRILRFMLKHPEQFPLKQSSYNTYEQLKKPSNFKSTLFVLRVRWIGRQVLIINGADERRGTVTDIQSSGRKLGKVGVPYIIKLDTGEDVYWNPETVIEETFVR